MPFSKWHSSLTDANGVKGLLRSLRYLKYWRYTIIFWRKLFYNGSSRLVTEVIYTTRFTAESVKENLGQFLRHFPDLIAAVEKIWQGSTKDYGVLQQIFVQLKKEVAEAVSTLKHTSLLIFGLGGYLKASPVGEVLDNDPTYVRGIT